MGEGWLLASTLMGWRDRSKGHAEGGAGESSALTFESSVSGISELESWGRPPLDAELGRHPSLLRQPATPDLLPATRRPSCRSRPPRASLQVVH